MKIRCVWERNGQDTLLYSENFVGAFSRGKTLEEALSKMQNEINSYLKWGNKPTLSDLEFEIVQEKNGNLNICDADTDVIFYSENLPLTEEEYYYLKELCLKSARDFDKLYNLIPDKDKSSLVLRKTFYGTVPRTANEMYEHTKNVNDYYFGEIGVETDNEGTIYQCRQKGFEILENTENFLFKPAVLGSYEEWWSLRKVLRRFIWHDRIHAKAMYRMALKTFDNEIENIFKF